MAGLDDFDYLGLGKSRAPPILTIYISSYESWGYTSEDRKIDGKPGAWLEVGVGCYPPLGVTFVNPVCGGWWIFVLGPINFIIGVYPKVLTILIEAIMIYIINTLIYFSAVNFLFYLLMWNWSV